MKICCIIKTKTISLETLKLSFDIHNTQKTKKGIKFLFFSWNVSKENRNISFKYIHRQPKENTQNSTNKFKKRERIWRERNWNVVFFFFNSYEKSSGIIIKNNKKNNIETTEEKEEGKSCKIFKLVKRLLWEFSSYFLCVP